MAIAIPSRINMFSLQHKQHHTVNILFKVSKVLASSQLIGQRYLSVSKALTLSTGCQKNTLSLMVFQIWSMKMMMKKSREKPPIAHHQEVPVVVCWSLQVKLELQAPSY
jgi:hypothetical protein